MSFVYFRITLDNISSSNVYNEEGESYAWQTRKMHEVYAKYLLLLSVSNQNWPASPNFSNIFRFERAEKLGKNKSNQ
jgi:hypothetical protein